MMVAPLNLLGTTDCDRERLKMSVNTPARSGAQALRTQPGMLSGPGALCTFTLSDKFKVVIEVVSNLRKPLFPCVGYSMQPTKYVVLCLYLTLVNVIYMLRMSLHVHIKLMWSLFSHYSVSLVLTVDLEKKLQINL